MNRILCSIFFLMAVPVLAFALPCSAPQQTGARYVAADGRLLEACFDQKAEAVTVQMAGEPAITLPRALSASGARYSDEKRTFWEHQGTGRYFAGETLLFEGRPQPAEYAAGVTSRILTRTSRTADGSAIVYPAAGQPEVTALLVELPPGGATGWHRHAVPVYAYMIAGTITVELEGDRQFTYRAGDAIIEVVGVNHNGTNTGTETARLVAFYTGVQGQPNVVKRP